MSEREKIARLVYEAECAHLGIMAWTNQPKEPSIYHRLADFVLQYLRDALASAHALRCTCLPGVPDPRCVELWALGGGAGDAEPGPGPLEGFRPGLQR